MTCDEILKAVKNKANLHGADLHGADLHAADLRWANLHGAALHAANLHGANLHGADLRWAKGIVDAGEDTRGYRFVGVRQEMSYRIFAGCRWFTPEEAEAHWGAKGNQDALLRCAVIRNGFKDR